MEADTLFIQLDDKVQQLAVDNPNEDANPLRTKCQDLKDTACYLKKTAEEKLNLCKYTQNLNEELESEINESKNWLQQNDDTLRTCGTLDLDTTMMTRTIHKFNVCANSISFIDNFFVKKIMIFIFADPIKIVCLLLLLPFSLEDAKKSLNNLRIMYLLFTRINPFDMPFCKSKNIRN